MIGHPRPGSAAPLASGLLDWQDHAACLGEDPDLFFPSDEEDEEDAAAWNVRAAKAKAVCVGCPVSADCRGFAMAAGIRTGIWGGIDFGERLCRNKRHRMTPANTLVRGDGSSNCKACRRSADKRYRTGRAQREEIAS